MSEKRATLPPPGTPNVLWIVDLSGYLFRAYHAITPLSNSKGEVTHAVMGTVNMIQKVVNEKKPHMLAVAMDSKSYNFRKAIDPRYKATRPPAPADLAHQMERARQIVEAYAIPIFEREGYEADDLIGSVVKRAVADGIRVVIVAADKDLMQLVHDDDDQVVLWDSMRDRVFGPAEVREKFQVKPSQVRDLLALMGDASDNVAGVPGIGPKTGAELLAAFGSIDGIYAHLADVKKAKVRESLATNEEDARLSQRLVTLRTDDHEIAWDRDQLVYGGAHTDELRRLFTELEFFRLLGEKEPRAPRTREDAAPPPRTRALDLLLDEPAIQTIAARAQETGVLGIAVVGTSDEAMRAAPVGLAISAEVGRGAYVPVGHRYLGAPRQPGLDVLSRALGPVLRDPAIVKCGHDLKYTEVVLACHGLAIEGPTFDSALAAYLFDPESPHALADLARAECAYTFPAEPPRSARAPKSLPDEIDVETATVRGAVLAELAVELRERLGPRLAREGLEPLFRDVETPLARVLARMEQVGVKVDLPVLEKASRDLEADLASLDRRARGLVGKDFSIRSRDQLEAILFDELHLPVLKKTPKGGRSTDAEVLEELALQHPLPAIVLEHRELDKLKGTYVDALPRAVNPRTGRIHTRFEQAVAATGRLSSSSPNLQNIPVRTDAGQRIRRAFVAEEGCSLVCADYSQIELRILAHLSGDARLSEAFREGGDVHRHTASAIFDVPRDEVTAEMRRRAKTINFGVIYGMGDAALAKQLGISRSEASLFIEQYFARYVGVKDFLARTVSDAKRTESVRTPMGRRRFLPNLHSANRTLLFEAERVARNTPIQGTAADIMKVAMVEVARAELPVGARMILTVHDELVFEVPDAAVEATGAAVKAIMERAMPLDVPLVVDVGSGKNWAVAH